MQRHLSGIPVGASTYSSAMSDAQNYIDWILKSFAEFLLPPILEIGVGHGSYAAILGGMGSYAGVDIDPDSVAAAKERFPSLDFAVADVTDDGFPATMADHQLKSILCLNVIEHIQNDQKAVANLARSLTPNGHLLIIVPALPILYNELDRLAGHWRRYRRSEINSLMQGAGLDVIRSDYFNPVGGLGWLANRFVRHKSLNDRAVNAQITLFDRWFVPVSRAINPLSRCIFGQSVIAVGRKP